MAVPILGQTPEGVCVLCKGPLTPNHEHQYIDKAELAYMLDVITGAAQNGCVVIDSNATAYFAHPLLHPPYMWHPVPATHTGPHDDCNITIVHHHCVNTSYIEETKGRIDEIPDGNVGVGSSEVHEGTGDSSNP